MTDLLLDRPFINRLGIAPGIVSIRAIQREICELRFVTLEQMKGRSQEFRIARPRQEAMHEAYLRTNKSLAEIGRAFGGRHKQVVYDSINAHRRRLGKTALGAPMGVKTRVAHA